MSRIRGATAIEFALTLPVILIIAAGVIDLSLYLSEVHNVERACRDSARVGAVTVDGTPPIGNDIEDAAIAHVSEVLTEVHLDPTVARTRANWRLDADGYCYLTVQVTYPFHAPFGLFPSVNDGVEASFTMMTRQQI